MLKLAFLLIGPKSFRSRWHVIAIVGVLLIGLGLALAAGMSGIIAALTYAALGVAFIAGGLVTLLGGLSAAGGADRRLALVKAGGAIVAGVLVLTSPLLSDWALALPFAVVFAADGLNRVAAAHVFRVRGWGLFALYGAAELALSAMILAGWPLPRDSNTPLCVGLFLGLSGWLLLRLGLMLRTLEDEAAILNLPIFSSRGWYDNAPVLVGDDPAPRTQHDRPLVVRIWTAVGSAAAPVDRRPVLDRYVAAIDRNGVVSTGHSALELAPDLYISHYPAVEVDRSSVSILTALRAGAENDVAGRFLPSYAEEVADWQPADASVELWHYDLRRLRAFWAGYRQDNTYNLANRNCSVVVASALDATLEGALATRFPWLKLAGLLMNPDVWMASLIRSRANSMSWTPGFVLDYARALSRIVDRPSLSWTERFRGFVKQLRSGNDDMETAAS
ncbi:protease [Azospirillum thiophilum]|uniref:Protease n=1 Tax=Azospirillum thiophilum TaxID=528244 RepID=A0AAC9EXA9_9PROT|nr:protease [Azospirillum thiophilum]ALG71017.1 protease [Azospirillum thiophilum]KJR65320.1 protease [Azospirillum thiophilum]